MAEFDYPAPVSQLLALGEPTDLREWADYLALGLGPEQIPDLIRLALDKDLYARDPAEPESWAVVHAWRALGQLRAEAAVEPLTGLLPYVDEYDDDWVAEELPEVYGLIGPAAVPTLAAYLVDPEHGQWARAAAADALGRIGQRHPQSRDACVAALTRGLEPFAVQDEGLNGTIISRLVDLDAVEAAPLMERAFAADRVDTLILGDWEDVQVELGLLEERLSPKPQFGWLPDLVDPGPGPPASEVGQEHLAQQRQAERRAQAKRKAKRKQQKQARRKQRKRK